MAGLVPAGLEARLQGLALHPRRAATGAGYGQHRSRWRGAGVEFAEYRAYQPGDDLRRLDWKLLARSDRPFVRESERESPLQLWLLVDATASMGQADRTRPGWSRLDAARLFAAALAGIALRQGDAFGLAALGGPAPVSIAPRAGARQRDRCVHALESLAADGAWPALPPRQLGRRIAPGALVVLLSDFLDPAAAGLAVALAATRRDVRALEILCRDELEFGFRGSHRFLDPETGTERDLHAPAARHAFLKAFEAHRSGLARRLAASGVQHVAHVLGEPPEDSLRSLLASSRSPAR